MAQQEGQIEIKNLLIDLVREKPIIYDKAHPDHFRANMRNEVWHEIGGVLGIPGKFYILYHMAL